MLANEPLTHLFCGPFAFEHQAAGDDLAWVDLISRPPSHITGAAKLAGSATAQACEMRFSVLVAFATFAGLPSAYAADDCKAIDERAALSGARIPGSEGIYRVVGQGRLQFYSAPSEACAMKGVFILPGEQVSAYILFGEFTAVMYVNRKTLVDVEGWVKTSRLEATGTGFAPKQ